MEEAFGVTPNDDEENNDEYDDASDTEKHDENTNTSSS
jgi:hypothetical protein